MSSDCFPGLRVRSPLGGFGACGVQPQPHLGRLLTTSWSHVPTGVFSACCVFVDTKGVCLQTLSGGKVAVVASGVGRGLFSLYMGGGSSSGSHHQLTCQVRNVLEGLRGGHCPWGSQCHSTASQVFRRWTSPSTRRGCSWSTPPTHTLLHPPFSMAM